MMDTLYVLISRPLFEENGDVCKLDGGTEGDIVGKKRLTSPNAVSTFLTICAKADAQ